MTPPRFNLAAQVRVLGAESLLPPARVRRKKNTAVEKVLQQEVMLRLKSYPVVAIPVPNGLWFPARTQAERNLVARIINQAKAAGMLSPSSADLVVLGAKAAGCIELKRGASRTLLERIPAGQLSEGQKEFRDRCARIGVNWAMCTSWTEVLAALTGWGVLA